MRSIPNIVLFFCILSLLSTSIYSQLSFQFVSKNSTINTHSGVHNPTGTDFSNVFTTTVTQSDAPWLQLYFSAYELGARSYIQITSTKDTAFQKLTTETLQQWKGWTAFFNGNEVTVELFQHPQDSSVFFNIEKYIYEVKDSTNYVAPSHCTYQKMTEDARIPSDYPGVARTFGYNANSNSGATAWLASNGAMVTAGHAVGNTFVQFNVPQALTADGFIQHPHPSDQYVKDDSSVVFKNEFDENSNPILGQDWGVFGVFPNSNTGLLPGQVQPGFFRTAPDNAISEMIDHPVWGAPGGQVNVTHVAGFGADHEYVFHVSGHPYPCKEYANTNRVQQDDWGYQEWTPQNYIFLRHINATSGNSGSPMFTNVNSLPYGFAVMTHVSMNTAGVTGELNSAYGTLLENPDFTAAMDAFYGNQTVHVDSKHFKEQTGYTRDGTVHRPYNSFSTAVAAASSNDLLVLTKGAYQEGLTISTPMRLIAPVGGVLIGPNAVDPDTAGVAKIVRGNTVAEATDDTPYKLALYQNYPNPFNPTTTISFTIPEQQHVELIVFDLLGRRVATLVDDQKNSGAHLIHFDASRFSSGIYFYQLKTGSKVIRKSMTLIK